MNLFEKIRANSKEIAVERFLHCWTNYPELPDNDKVYNIDDFKDKDGNDLGRHYAIPTSDGKTEYYPSMTNVLGQLAREESERTGVDWLKDWRERVGEDAANDISFRASRRGTHMHDMCERYLRNQNVSSTHLAAWKLFKKLQPMLDNINNIAALEHALYSRILRIAGRADCIGEYNMLLTLIDFKSSRKLKNDDNISEAGYKKQVCGYAFCFTELTGVTLDFGQILIGCDSDGTNSGEATAIEFEVIIADHLGTFLDKVVDLRIRQGFHMPWTAQELYDAYFYGGLKEMSLSIK